MSIVYTSHYMEEVELLCNRVAIIDEGKIIAMDTIKNLIATPGGGVIHIGLTDADDQLLAQLAALPAVKDARIIPVPAAPPPAEGADIEVLDREPASMGVLIEILLKNSQQAIVNVIGYLNDRDIHLTSLEILEPNLESVFLHLTGKKLRE
jgi:ABC-2 type transport system ATP-binding protein